MFLTCDPYPASAAVTQFKLWMDAAPVVVSPALINADGSAALHYDLTSLAAGNHTVKVSAANGWAESPQSVPFAFVKPSASLAAPSGLKLSNS